MNSLRVLRALQVDKPVLLEGSPGVGKTTLVMALAKASGHRLERLNLSDQTDLADLFGNDLPVEGGSVGQFAWRSAAFLRAMEAGDWVLLDEMNLAPQPVLEGLNSCLDHRGEVFVPELGRAFKRHSSFRIFAAQNPLAQGSSRKGLPRSFVDRFTTVYLSDLTPEDLKAICQALPGAAAISQVIEQLIDINIEMNELPGSHPSFGISGAPWEFNLRDLLRWLDLLSTPTGLEVYPGTPLEHFQMLCQQRFRSRTDRQLIAQTCSRIVPPAPTILSASILLDESAIEIGRHGWSPTACFPLHKPVLSLSPLHRKNFFH